MAKAPTRAALAVATARGLGSPVKTLMPDHRARGFGLLHGTIGAIPGVGLTTFSVAPFAGPDGRTAVTLVVTGRGPSLHASTMEWKGRADLEGPTPADVHASLAAAFTPRIKRQATRAEDAITILGNPLPWPVHETNTSCLHLSIDRLALWAETRLGHTSPHETETGRRIRIAPDRLMLCLGLEVARTAKAIIADGDDTGGRHVGNGTFERIREIRVDGHTMREVALKKTAGSINVMGPSIAINDIRMPETLCLAARGRTFGSVFDAASKFGPSLAAITTNRTIERIVPWMDGILVDLSPDPVLLADIPSMTLAKITGEDDIA